VYETRYCSYRVAGTVYETCYCSCQVGTVHEDLLLLLEVPLPLTVVGTVK
jgi:hypothetical protein